jgi:hypothetical protein
MLGMDRREVIARGVLILVASVAAVVVASLGGCG